MKILIGCLNFQGLTGSEISVLETSKELAKLGIDVTVTSPNISEKYRLICKANNIKTALLSEPPGYKLGDGRWRFETLNGTEPSKPNVLYLVSKPEFDILWLNHTPVAEYLIKLYPNTKAVMTCRAEFNDLENPYIHDNIKKYVTIRDTMTTHLIDNFNIKSNKIKLIYNPFDRDKFKSTPQPVNEKPITLFVGTMDYLRKNPIIDLIKKCEDENKELWLVGKDSQGYAMDFSRRYEHVKYYPPTEKIEEFFQKCNETAGIYLGRTTVEGYFSNRPGIIYFVDKYGNIIDDPIYTTVPSDLDKFDKGNCAINYSKLFKEICNTQ